MPQMLNDGHVEALSSGRLELRSMHLVTFMEALSWSHEPVDELGVMQAGRQTMLGRLYAAVC